MCYNRDMKIIIRWIISALAIAIAAYVLPGVHVAGVVSALVLAVVLGAINTFIKPLLVILTLPLSILTLGLFMLVLNAFLIILATLIVPGFSVDGFWWALLFSIVLTIVHTILEKFNKE
jgi:putative membrane protein